MKHFGLLSCIVLLTTLPLAGQTQFVGENYFPAEMEFPQLGAVQSTNVLHTPAALSQIPDGLYFVEAGVKEYSRRIYTLADGGTLNLEVVEFNDDRAPYSLLTLLRNEAELVDGPPGLKYAAGSHQLVFSQGPFWVRARGADAELNRRVAVSVGNRIGVRAAAAPSLVTHFPEEGYQAASLKYFVGPHAFASYADGAAAKSLAFTSDSEIAQARYSVRDRSGTLTLINFPTAQLAEQYYDSVGIRVAQDAKDVGRIYLKRAGPLVGILNGNFEPAGADKILSGIEFTYAIQWIFDRNKRSGEVIWGVPTTILGTVVRSLAFVAMLAGLSLLAGAALALFRIGLRTYAPHNYLDRPERTEMIRLKINEN